MLRNGVKLPLRLKLDGKGCAVLWVNGHMAGRYHGDWGPQTSFYIPDGVLKNGPNEVVVAAYGQQGLSVAVEPYRVHPSSGNIAEDRDPFCVKQVVVR